MKIRCPHCGAHLNVRDELTGRQGRCPRCRKESWCSACVGKLDEVDQLREQFAGDKPLVVLGANLDENPLQVREFLKSKPLPWVHALLGDWSSTDVPRRFAVSGVPAYVLIGPDGRILASENSLAAIGTKLKGLSHTWHDAPKSDR